MIINSVHFSMLGTNRVEQQASSYCLNILTKQFFANFTLGKEKEHMPNWPENEGGGAAAECRHRSYPHPRPSSAAAGRLSGLGLRRRLWRTNAAGAGDEGDCSPREGKRGATWVPKLPMTRRDVRFSLLPSNASSWEFMNRF